MRKGDGTGRDVGHGSGWSVDEDPDGGFRRSADGPTGSLSGHASTRAEAEAAARAAEQRLIEDHAERRRPPRVERSGDDAQLPPADEG
jgi:hypothetical protein